MSVQIIIQFVMTRCNNSYNFFCEDYYRLIQLHRNDKRQSDTQKILARLWRNLNHSEKMVYKKKVLNEQRVNSKYFSIKCTKLNL